MANVEQNSSESGGGAGGDGIVPLQVDEIDDVKGVEEDFIPLCMDDDADAAEEEDVVIPDRPDQHPWVRNWRKLQTMSPQRRLHEELLQFSAYMSPTQEEEVTRCELIDRVRLVTQRVLPGAQLGIFGSVATKLYLPISDLDIVLLYKCQDPKICLRMLADELQIVGMVSFIELILTARVPIIKFTDKSTGIAVDVSINVETGFAARDFVNSIMQQCPLVRPLTLFLKYFLYFRGLNDTYTGGVGSFLLQLMIINHIQMPASGSSSVTDPSRSDMDLASALISFFERFGRTFNYVKIGISTRDGGSYFCKADRGWKDVTRPFLLSVENPLDPALDVGRNSFNIMRVRRAFGWAYDRLVAKNDLSDCESVLGRLVGVRSEVFANRAPLSVSEDGDEILPSFAGRQNMHWQCGNAEVDKSQLPINAATESGGRRSQEHGTMQRSKSRDSVKKDSVCRRNTSAKKSPSP